MIFLRWVARMVFAVALVVWGGMAVRSMDHPETWTLTRHRTAAFMVLMGAGLRSGMTRIWVSP